MSLRHIAPFAAALLLAPQEDPFGTPPPGAPAVPFAPAILGGRATFASTFTADGRTVVFTLTDPERTFLRLMTSRWADGRWSAPEPASFGSAAREMDAAIAADGAIWYTSARPAPGAPAADTALDFDTWMAPRDGQGWGAPVRVAAASVRGAHDMYPSVTRDGTIYFDSARPGVAGAPAGRRHLWRARRLASGEYAPAEPLPPLINDGGATNPYVDPDERFLVFAAERPGGHGRADLWISHRTADGWSAPRNLGPRVNSADVEFCPNVPARGGAFFFSRVQYAGETGEVRVGQGVYVVHGDVLGGQ